MINYGEKLTGKKVLVTGGLGFVGHNLVKTLVDHYRSQVVVVDDCSNSQRSALSGHLDRVEFHQISVLEKDKLFSLLKDVNYIFHLACRQISACGFEPNIDLRVNAESTLNLLEYLRLETPKNFERFVYASSCSVYGSMRNLPAREDGVTHVLSQYAATKLLGENYTLMYNALYDLSTTSLRYSNVYGYGQTPRNPYCGVIGRFVHHALTGKALTIVGDGQQTRDYTFITDAVEATLLAAVHPKAIGEVFNVGTGVETSVNRIAQLICENTPRVEAECLPERDIDNIRRRSVDISLIHQRLGWAPRVSIEEGIGKTIEWYQPTL